MLKPILLVSAMALVVIAPGPSWPAGPPPQAKGAAQSDARAKKLYAMDCALCHGDTGDGKTDLAKDMQLTLSDWTDPKTLSDKKDDDLFKIIRNGKDKMPPEDAGRAKDDEIHALIIYIRTFSKNAPAAPAAAPAAPPAAAPAASATPAPGNQ
jgi:mono/diheme cytochrome c family protein